MALFSQMAAIIASGGGGGPSSYDPLLFSVGPGGTNGNQDKTDQSSYGRTITWGTGATVDDAEVFKTQKGVRFDGTSDASMSLADSSDFDIAGQDFAIALRAKFNTGFGVGLTLFGRYVTTGDERDFRLGLHGAARRANFQASYDGTGTDTAVADTIVLDALTAYEIAYEKIGGDGFLFVDGALVAQHNYHTDAEINYSAGGLLIGQDGEGGPYFDGWLYALKFMVGGTFFGGQQYSPNAGAL